MSCDGNETSKNDDDDTFSDLYDLNNALLFLHDYLEPEADDLENELLGNTMHDDEKNELYLPIETNTIMHIFEQAPSLSKNSYDRKDSNSSLNEFSTETVVDSDCTCCNSLCFSNSSCSSPVSVISVANANDSLCNASMQLALENNVSQSNYASINNNADVNEYNKANTTTLTILPESPFEKKTKRNYRSTESHVPNKKCKTCKSIKSQYPDGNETINAIITDEDIKKYESFKNEVVKCRICNGEVSFSKVFLVGNKYVCDECAKEERIDLLDLKTDVYDLLDYTGERLYKCKRLQHARPLYQFIKFSDRTKKYRIVTNCCYCRLYKAQEDIFKKN